MTDSKTVVVIDDSPSIRETIAFILQSEGFEVYTAVNGREGLELVRSVRPRAVLLDAMMPEMDGFDVCRQIRGDGELASTQVIMLTTMGMEVDRERALNAGVNHFLTKPFDDEQVLELLDEAFAD